MDNLSPRTLHEEFIHHNNVDPHKRGSGLSDFILGAQDGLVNVLGVVLGIAAAIGIAWMPKPIPVDIVDAKRGSMRVTIDEDGLARVKDRYVISAPLSGSMARITLDPGDSVNQGQVVAWIEPLAPPSDRSA